MQAQSYDQKLQRKNDDIDFMLLYLNYCKLIASRLSLGFAEHYFAVVFCNVYSFCGYASHMHALYLADDALNDFCLPGKKNAPTKTHLISGHSSVCQSPS